MRSGCSASGSARLLAAFLAWHASAALAADDLAIDVQREGRSFTVHAAATLAAPAALVWEVLTDYDKLPRFVPGLASSTVQLRAGNRAVVEQKGEARFLVFSYPIEVRLEIAESPGRSIVSRGVAGNLKRMRGRYDLHHGSQGIYLRYAGELEPDFELPPLIGTLAVRIMVEEQFAALVAEIERRASATR
jgi:ribosome-associated toxin RatA of RatAB toxin-antitoxin module